jgi:hypothetical protein
MDLRYVVSVLMGHRDAIRRWEAESGTPQPDATAGAAPQ